MTVMSEDSDAERTKVLNELIDKSHDFCELARSFIAQEKQLGRRLHRIGSAVRRNTPALVTFNKLRRNIFNKAWELELVLADHGWKRGVPRLSDVKQAYEDQRPMTRAVRRACALANSLWTRALVELDKRALKTPAVNDLNNWKSSRWITKTSNGQITSSQLRKAKQRMNIKAKKGKGQNLYFLPDVIKLWGDDARPKATESPPQSLPKP